MILAGTLLLGGALASRTWIFLQGETEIVLEARQIRDGRTALAVLPAPPAWWPGVMSVRMTEDGESLGPEVARPADVARELSGTFSLVVRGGTKKPRYGALYFSATDDSIPRRNGRRYGVLVPRGQLPAAWAVSGAVWGLVPVLAFAVGRRFRAGQSLVFAPTSAGAVAVIVLGLLYCAFAVRARLVDESLYWWLAIGAVGMVPFLSTPARRREPPPAWSWLLAAFLGWAWLTIWLAPHATGTTVIRFTLVCLVGWVCYRGTRASLSDGHDLGVAVAGGLLFVTAMASLARDAGSDPAALLKVIGLEPESGRNLRHPWTTKFLAHWIFLLFWCHLTALAKRCRTGPVGFAVALFGIAAIFVNGSKTAGAALAFSLLCAGCALRWPRVTRRLLMSSLVIGLLLAPLLAAVPWWLHDKVGSGRAVAVLELDIRGGVWEYARQVISDRPWAGWGFGASSNLPGRQRTIAEVLWQKTEPPPLELTTHEVLPGGHPHNLALLVWTDLGLIGVAIVAGFVIAVSRSISRLEGAPRVHAALIGLLSGTSAILVCNYPAWHPAVASILWIGPILVSSLLPLREGL